MKQLFRFLNLTLSCAAALLGLLVSIESFRGASEAHLTFMLVLIIFIIQLRKL